MKAIALNSIRLRLLILAMAGILATLALAGFGFVALFERHVERRVGRELETTILQLAGNLRLGETGALSLQREPADPRFEKPYGGFYWQVQDVTKNSLLRSRSLWDSELGLDTDALAAGESHSHNGISPDGEAVLVHEKAILVGEGADERLVRISVGLDRTEMETLSAGFARDMLPGLGLLAAVLLLGGWAQVRSGLRPLGPVRQAVADIRAGSASRLPVNVPTEISPLVEEVNSLLSGQEQEMKRARDRAADLAHGLKTPLTALASDIARLRARKENAIADDIEAVAQQMARTIERELARSRLRHSSRAIAPVRLDKIANGLVRTLKRTPKGEKLAYDLDAGQAESAMMAEDLTEILGNLMENATRYAKANVRVTAGGVGSTIWVSVEDDGPGVPAEKLAQLQARGARLDESGSSGLGLAIVSDILALHGSALEFSASSLGGLCVRFALPGSPKAAKP